jgi:hypothetical protein
MEILGNFLFPSWNNDDGRGGLLIRFGFGGRGGGCLVQGGGVDQYVD